MYLSFRHLIFLGDRSSRELKFLRAPIAPVTAERAEKKFNNDTRHTGCVGDTNFSATSRIGTFTRTSGCFDPPLISNTRTWTDTTRTPLPQTVIHSPCHIHHPLSLPLAADDHVAARQRQLRQTVEPQGVEAVPD